MPKPTTPKDILLFSQWKEWADEVDRKLNLILAAVTGKNSPLIPELEREINRTTALAYKVDRKVPDNARKDTTGSN